MPTSPNSRSSSRGDKGKSKNSFQQPTDDQELIVANRTTQIYYNPTRFGLFDGLKVNQLLLPYIGWHHAIYLAYLESEIDGLAIYLAGEESCDPWPGYDLHCYWFRWDPVFRSEMGFSGERSEFAIQAFLHQVRLITVRNKIAKGRWIRLTRREDQIQIIKKQFSKPVYRF